MVTNADISRARGLSASKILERELGRLLKSDDLLKELITDPVPVFTSPSEDDTPTYLLYTEARLTDWSDDTSHGGEHIITITVYSSMESEASVKEILDAVQSRLDRCDRYLSISPYSLVTLDFQLQDVIKETDGQMYQGTAQFRALTGG